MAIISAGILGRTSGKVASVVGGRWKGINYIREKVTPKNPKTTLQKAQRSNIRLAVAWTKTLIGVLLIPFVDRFTRRKSGYNFVVGRNVMNFEGLASGNDVPADSAGTWGNQFQVSRGSLANVPGLTIAVATGTITLSWSASALGTLQPNDYLVASISTLDGTQPAVVQQAALSTGTLVIAAANTTNMVGKKCVVSAMTVRYNRPATQEVPLAISNSQTSVITR